MDNNPDLTIESEEEDPHPSSLEKLAESLLPIKHTPPYIHDRISFHIDHTEQKVTIGIMIYVKSAKKKIFHHAFSIYDADKPVQERHVADNEKFMKSLGHPLCHKKIKEFLVDNGYCNFHNPYSDYLSKRFHEHIKENNIGIYSTKVL